MPEKICGQVYSPLGKLVETPSNRSSSIAIDELDSTYKIQSSQLLGGDGSIKTVSNASTFKKINEAK